MRLAVFSDIHGNLTALEAVLADLDTVGEVDLIWCLGDLAAMGSRPLECIGKIRDLQATHGDKKFKVVGGNTDRYMVTGKRPDRPAAQDEEAFDQVREAIPRMNTIFDWALQQLDWESYEFLKKIIGRETRTMVKGYGPVIGYHAIPGDDEPMSLRPDTPDEEAVDALLDRQGKLAIGGHTHRAMDRVLGQWRVLNPGSVGLSWVQPGIAEWLLVTIEDGEVQVDFRSVPYDVEAVKADLKMVEFPHPEFVIRLLTEKS